MVKTGIEKMSHGWSVWFRINNHTFNLESVSNHETARIQENLLKNSLNEFSSMSEQAGWREGFGIGYGDGSRQTKIVLDSKILD